MSRTVLALNSVLHFQEFNNKIKLIGLMAVCSENIMCDTLRALLIFELSQNKIYVMEEIQVFNNIWVLCRHVLKEKTS
jgi:hypothetical protein